MGVGPPKKMRTTPIDFFKGGGILKRNLSHGTPNPVETKKKDALGELELQSRLLRADGGTLAANAGWSAGAGAARRILGAQVDLRSFHLGKLCVCPLHVGSPKLASLLENDLFVHVHLVK